MSSYIVFPVTGLVVTSLLVVVLIEKFICVPKRLSRLILHLTGNKMLHQLMAITNILTLLSCVLLPMVRLLHFHWICPQWGQILWKNAIFAKVYCSYVPKRPPKFEKNHQHPHVAVLCPITNGKTITFPLDLSTLRPNSLKKPRCICPIIVFNYGSSINAPKVSQIISVLKT